MCPPLTEETAEAIRVRLYPSGLDRAAVAPCLTRFVQAEGDLLPAAESPLAALGRELYREGVLLDRCIEILATDAGLAQAVLRTAHLAALGSRTFTLNYAVMFLGLARLRLVFGIEILRRMNAARLSGAWIPFWERNLFAARVGERIASHYHPVDGTEYLAGLFHDAAWPALASFFRGEYKVPFDAPEGLFPLERQVFGTSHGAIGAAICLRSGLPPHVVEAVARHHDAVFPDRTSIRSPRYNGPFLGAVLQLADRMADAVGFPPHGEAAQADSIGAAAASPAGRWLASFRPLPDLALLAQEERRQVVHVRSLFDSE